MGWVWITGCEIYRREVLEGALRRWKGVGVVLLGEGRGGA